MPTGKKQFKKTRRRTREIVLQALYAGESSGESPDDTLRELAQETELPENLRQFALELCHQVSLHRNQFDDLIRNNIQNWALERVVRIDRLILYIALAEFYYFDDVPPKVSINEAIELARQFSTTDSPAFVNGVLDSIITEEVPWLKMNKKNNDNVEKCS